MKVYVLEKNYPYEGSDILGIFSSVSYIENILGIKFNTNDNIGFLYCKYPFDYDTLTITEYEIDYLSSESESYLINDLSKKDAK